MRLFSRRDLARRSRTRRTRCPCGSCPCGSCPCVRLPCRTRKWHTLGGSILAPIHCRRGASFSCAPPCGAVHENHRSPPAWPPEGRAPLVSDHRCSTFSQVACKARACSASPETCRRGRSVIFVQSSVRSAFSAVWGRRETRRRGPYAPRCRKPPASAKVGCRFAAACRLFEACTQVGIPRTPLVVAVAFFQTRGSRVEASGIEREGGRLRSRFRRPSACGFLRLPAPGGQGRGALR